MELPMSETNTVSPQRSHIYSCKRFAAWLKRSPDTVTPDWHLKEPQKLPPVLSP